MIQKACWAFMYFFLFILLFKGSRKYQVGMCSEIVMFQMDPQAPQSKFFFFSVVGMQLSFFSSDDRF